MTIVEMAAALRRGETTSVALTQEALDRIAARNGELNAFLTVTADHALAAARERDAELRRGHDRGPLHGIPYAAKDCFATRGIRTTAGSPLFAEFVPEEDAAAVERLAEAGAVLAGKTHLHELAYGITSSNPHFGPVRNPHNLAHVPGGSSGGSAAAVAAGLVPFALGTDTGGSIRIPAAFCGCVGLKPTFGRVSRRGVIPLGFSLDHMGPITRTVRDAALVLQVLAGVDPGDDSSSSEPVPDYTQDLDAGLAGLRVGLPRGFLVARLDDAVRAAFDRACARIQLSGATLAAVDLPDMAAVTTTARVVLLAEAAAVHERNVIARRDAFGADVLALLDQGRLLPATDYIHAQQLRRQFREQMRAVWAACDVLLTATTATPAPRIGQASIMIEGVEEDVRLASTRLVRGWNLLGNPALSVPAGVNPEGLPVGVQVVGPAFAEGLVLRVGQALEAVV